jgi:hypothetical protein
MPRRAIGHNWLLNSLGRAGHYSRALRVVSGQSSWCSEGLVLSWNHHCSIGGNSRRHNYILHSRMVRNDSRVSGRPSADKTLLWRRMDQGNYHRNPSDHNRDHNHCSSGAHRARVSWIGLQRANSRNLRLTFSAVVHLSWLCEIPFVNVDIHRLKVGR